ncbi:TetR/AcrR family transcriptional regulator [Microvirga sp. SRT01]|uniref:TetR/AcrR family transcriptional regulator n=1 Tax=Sphingomonas longa TaxID=2778730 RepID=A0ABS2D6G6_9SPHN|nr:MULTISPECIES: TetR/AcrR family transcriptional regulator [Alphaproteobacteria]MBM6576505.1 TetR/AcrR family transcriptional regulator [Sphingomonas sp. BT552]MBR7709551.1 TetR/AcrR family transcriptional regulator [Microvirga sp. SRT01]
MEASFSPAPAIAPKGRPREFCTDMALASALRVFWSKGYEGASMADLTEAMGITKPSLYAAFGNKEALFHKALDLYEQEKLEYTRVALDQPTARAVAEYYMRGALESQTSNCDPKGCLGVIHSMACGAEAESIKADVIARRASSQAALVARFERAKEDGDLPAHVDAAGLTSYLYALLQGMAVQAGSGATRGDLERLIDTSLAMWPSR